ATELASFALCRRSRAASRASILSLYALRLQRSSQDDGGGTVAPDDAALSSDVNRSEPSVPASAALVVPVGGLSAASGVSVVGGLSAASGVSVPASAVLVVPLGGLSA